MQKLGLGTFLRRYCRNGFPTKIKKIHAKADYLAVVCENFFKGKGWNIDGLNCHTVEFYYYMKNVDRDMSSCKHMTDEGEEQVWLEIEEIERSNIKPNFIKERIHEILNERKTIHVIDERDREVKTEKI